jgi:hypothetical protein
MIPIWGLLWSKAYRPLKIAPIFVEDGIQLTHQAMNNLLQKLSSALQRFTQGVEQGRKLQRVSFEQPLLLL